LSGLLPLFVNNLLPIFLIVAVGVLFGSFNSIDTHTLSQLILYIFCPCLIFTTLTQSQVSNDQFLRILAYSLIFCALIGAVAFLAGKLLNLGRGAISKVMLATMFTNAGNYGLPVVLFALGQEALSYASIFFVLNLSLAYTVGTVIASMSSVSILKAIVNLLKLPLLYAFLLALLFINTGWSIPLPLERATKLLGDAAIPCMLLLVGLQIHAIQLNGKVLSLGLISVMRLVAGPGLAMLLLPLFGLDGTASQALVLQAGMPTAVITTVLAEQYDAEPAFASAAVMVTTLLSPMTLTPLLRILGA
jgi:predicted permease